MASTEVLISAGGTREPIDDVRYIGNFSSGRFGHTLAKQYAEHGHQVTLAAPNITIERFGLPAGVEHVPFMSAEDLRAVMLGYDAADLILHSAAVSDYTPQRTDGKISSDQEKLVIELERTPKILAALRDHFGPETTIVGFKLLSGVTPEHLIDVARRQVETNDTDYSLANLLEDIDSENGERRIQLVQSDGVVLPISGRTDSVASAVYDEVQWEARNE